MFGGNAGAVRALDDVCLHIQPGECLGLVGESGCGKTTLSKIIMRAIDADEGEVLYNDSGQPVSILDLSERELGAYRRKVQFVFQDPFSSLNPRMTVFDLISEPLIIHGLRDAKRRGEIVTELMHHVGLDPRFLSRYPHSFSGGQRQRIGVARALALNPTLLICDEPVSALDVSVQAQVLNLLKDLQADRGLTYLFVSHNLGRGRLYGGPDRSDVCRASGRDCAARVTVSTACPSVYEGVTRRRAANRSRPQIGPFRADGR